MNHVTLSVPDVPSAVAFYVDVLGCRRIARWSTGAYLLAGELWLALVEGPAESRGAEDYSHIAFGVLPDEFATMSARITASRVDVWQDNWTEGQSLYFRDPAGHQLEIHATSLHERLRDARDHPWDGLVIDVGADDLTR